MNKDIINAKVKQIKGRSRVWWGKLTHNRRDRIAGRIQVLAGFVGEKYSTSRHKASRMIIHRTKGYKSWKK